MLYIVKENGAEQGNIINGLKMYQIVEWTYNFACYEYTCSWQHAIFHILHVYSDAQNVDSSKLSWLNWGWKMSYYNSWCFFYAVMYVWKIIHVGDTFVL